MDETEGIASEYWTGERPAPTETPAWAVPEPHSGPVGELARQLLGTRETGPDFTAAVPLADAIQNEYGYHASVEFVAGINRLVFHWMHNASDDPRRLRDVTQKLHSTLRVVVRPYLYDFASTAGVLAAIVERARQPVVPPQTGQVSLDVVYLTLSPAYTVGDRVTMPDGRDGIVVRARDAAGVSGVVPCESNGPRAQSSMSYLNEFQTGSPI